MFALGSKDFSLNQSTHHPGDNQYNHKSAGGKENNEDNVVGGEQGLCVNLSHLVWTSQSKFYLEKIHL